MGCGGFEFEWSPSAQAMINAWGFMNESWTSITAVPEVAGGFDGSEPRSATGARSQGHK